MTYSARALSFFQAGKPAPPAPTTPDRFTCSTMSIAVCLSGLQALRLQEPRHTVVRALDDDGIDEPPHLLRRGLPRRERLLDVLLRPGEDDDGFAPCAFARRRSAIATPAAFAPASAARTHAGTP